MQNSLVAIEEIISRARKSGATLGHGDPKVHLAYLTKLRLLPQTIRRKIGDKIVGCYPEQVLTTLKKIEELKSSGLSYAQVRYQLNSPTPPVPNFTPSYDLSADRYSPLVFLIIGLILGFLLAVNTRNSTSTSNPTAATLPPETGSERVVQAVTSAHSQSEPIYLIAIPDQNLYKLGKTNINLLR